MRDFDNREREREREREEKKKRERKREGAGEINDGNLHFLIVPKTFRTT